MRYFTQHGESPATIAHRFGTTREALVAANPQKPTRIVAGQRTWQNLGVGEELNVPGLGDGSLAGLVGTTWLIQSGDFPFKIAQTVTGNGNRWKEIVSANPGMKIINDPKVGPALSGFFPGKTINLPSSWFPGAPAVALPTLPTLPGLPSIPAGFPTSLPSIPAGFPTSLPSVAVAVAALGTGIDPCLSVNAPMVCAAQAALGLKPDGKYGDATAAAVRALVPSAPRGCSPAPLHWGTKDKNLCTGAGAFPSIPLPPPVAPPVFVPPAPVPIPVFTPPAPPIALPSIPIPLPIPTPTAPPIQAAPPVFVPPPVVTIPSAPAATIPVTAEVVTTPGEKKGISTGAIVAGAIGAAALVAVVAIAATGKKTTVRSARRAPAKKARKKKR